MIRKPSNGAFPKTEKSVLLWPPTISGVQLYQRMRIRLPRFSMHGQLINLLFGNYIDAETTFKTESLAFIFMEVS